MPARALTPCDYNMQSASGLRPRYPSTQYAAPPLESDPHTDMHRPWRLMKRDVSIAAVFCSTTPLRHATGTTSVRSSHVTRPTVSEWSHVTELLSAAQAAVRSASSPAISRGRRYDRPILAPSSAEMFSLRAHNQH